MGTPTSRRTSTRSPATRSDDALLNERAGRAHEGPTRIGSCSASAANRASRPRRRLRTCRYAARELVRWAVWSWAKSAIVRGWPADDDLEVGGCAVAPAGGVGCGVLAGHDFGQPLGEPRSDHCHDRGFCWDRLSGNRCSEHVGQRRGDSGHRDAGRPGDRVGLAGVLVGTGQESRRKLGDVSRVDEADPAPSPQSTTPRARAGRARLSSCPGGSRLAPARRGRCRGSDRHRA